MKMENSVFDAHHILLPALEQSFVAVVVIDENDSVLFFNQAAERLWGFERAEVLGRHMQLLLPQSLRPVHGGYIRNNREGGKPKVVGMSRDILMERKDGQQFWSAFSLSKIDVSGRIHYMAFVRDVSDEVARREENRLLLLAVNHTDRVVFVLDHERRIVQINRAFTELFGYEAAEVLGKVPSELLASTKATADEITQLRRKAWGSVAFHDDILATRKDGRDVWVRFSVNPIPDETDAGKIRNLVVALSDVTEERQIRDLERDVLGAMTSSLSFRELGEFLCRRIESIAPGVQVSVCQVVEGKLRLWAAPNFPADYGAAIDGLEIREGAGSCGTTAHRGEPVMVADIASDPLWEHYRHLDLPFLRACWSYPVKRHDGTVAGTFAFYFRAGYGPNAYLERIADASVHLCTLAIEREKNRQQMTRMVRFDALTGLPNRNNLHSYLDELLASAAGREVSVFSLNLDRFKDINDSLGHGAGDQVLVAMANRLQSFLKQGEFLSRTEGDLFVIVAPDCDARRASVMAGHIQDVVRAKIAVGGHPLNLSASIGISHYPEGGDDREVLLANASNAMYQAQASGGGTYQFLSPEMTLMVRNRLLRSTALKNAVANGGLHLFYQPQVSTDSGGLFGVEALARWHDPQFGDVPPSNFIALAEEIGEIEAIGRWALTEACRQMAAWRAEGVQVPVVSVNLSSFSFRNLALPEFVAGLLREHGLPGECLTIEITESLMMAVSDETLDILRRIRMLGVGLSMDDFGTGFSSLSNLANLPVTEVKIDRSFIDKCLQESRLQSLVLAVIGIGRSLGLTVVAEGVETEEQHRLLNELDCPVLQGYLFARPLPPQDISGWVKALAQKAVR